MGRHWLGRYTVHLYGTDGTSALSSIWLYGSMKSSKLRLGNIFSSASCCIRGCTTQDAQQRNRSRKRRTKMMILHWLSGRERLISSLIRVITPSSLSDNQFDGFWCSPSRVCSTHVSYGFGVRGRVGSSRYSVSSYLGVSRFYYLTPFLQSS